MYDEYKRVRGSVGLPKDELLPVDATSSNQICDVFGIHPNLPFLKESFDQKEAIFFAGVGVLSEPVTKDNYLMKTKTQLFAHNTSKFLSRTFSTKLFFPKLMFLCNLNTYFSTK